MCTHHLPSLGQAQGISRENHSSSEYETPGLRPALGPQHHCTDPPRPPHFPFPFLVLLYLPTPFSSIPLFSIKRETLRIPFPHLVPLCAYLLPTPFAQPSGSNPSLLECHQFVFFSSPTSPSLSAPSCQWQPDCSQNPLSGQPFLAKDLKKAYILSSSQLLIPRIPRSRMPPNLIDAFQFICLFVHIPQRN